MCQLDDSIDLKVELTNFDVKNARCYDPNEEAKIREVVKSTGATSGGNGTDEFNEKIRSIGHQMKRSRTSFTPVKNSTNSNSYENV
jgi:hypothetical protein